MASSSTKPNKEAAPYPMGPEGSRVELKQDANAIIINSACDKCIKDNVACKVEEVGKPCTHCKDDEKANRACNAHGLIPEFWDTWWPCAAAIVHIGDYREAACLRHFETPQLSCLVDCFEHLHDVIIMHRRAGLLPTWCPTLDPNPPRAPGIDGRTYAPCAEEIPDLPASMVKRVLEWREWEKLCPLAAAIPPPVFRDNWLEREEQAQRRKRARR